MKKLSATLLLLILVSCISALDEKTVTKFKDQDLEKFIRERFIDKISVANKFALSLDKIIPLPGRGLLAKKDEFRRKNFIYKAYFNSANTSLLTMPAEDLRLFCQQSGGEFLQTQKFQKDYFVSREFYPVKYFYAEDGKLKEEMMLKEYSTNRMPADARDAYNDVYKRGFFGDFVCEVSDKKIWTVSIYPVGFAPNDSKSQLGAAHLLLLQIIPNPS